MGSEDGLRMPIKTINPMIVIRSIMKIVLTYEWLMSYNFPAIVEAKEAKIKLVLRIEKLMA